MKTILVPTDFSGNPDKALIAAKQEEYRADTIFETDGVEPAVLRQAE